MKRKIAVGAIALSLILIIASCSAPTPTAVPSQKPVQTPASAATATPAVNPTQPASSNAKPSGPIEAKWIEAEVSANLVSIPVAEVKNNWNTHFKVAMQGSNLTFMAYVFDGEIQVRGNVCPPCRSIGYTLSNDTLVCDTCATTFKARNGDGIKGACVNYPKAAVQYKIIEGNIVMSETDLLNAYQETLKAG